VSTDVKSSVVFLEGERVYLRPLEAADAEQFRQWLCDPSVRTGLKIFAPITEKMEREFIENSGSNPNDFRFAIVRKEDDRLIGAASLHNTRWKDRSSSFGLLIGDTECRGHGYGTEATLLALHYAFVTLNLNRVELGVYDFNKPAIRVYEKLGFVLEGNQRQHSFVEGRYVDHYAYSMLAGEYFAAHLRPQPSKTSLGQGGKRTRKSRRS
jgi:RimJ/RimL family protein N-acetyltransferase